MNKLLMLKNLSISCKIPDFYLVLKKKKIWLPLFKQVALPHARTQGSSWHLPV